MNPRAAFLRFVHSFMGRMMLGLLAINVVLLPPTFFLIIRYVAEEHEQEFINNVRAHSHEILAQARVAAADVHLQCRHCFRVLLVVRVLHDASNLVAVILRRRMTLLARVSRLYQLVRRSDDRP